MERIRSRTAFALGGAGRVRGGGQIALLAAALLAGVGCTGQRAWKVKDVLPPGWVPTEPATQITPAFSPQLQYLPDPTQEGNLRPGIVGQMFVLARDGSFTEANGELVVMAEDVTPRQPGQPAAVPEVWQFDPVALRKLRTKDERFGDCYALFLPYPPNWKDVTHLRISTKYEPKGDRTKEPVLYGPPQTMLLDFTPPGSQQAVWMDKSGPPATAPAEFRAIPNVSRDMARGGFGAPLVGPQPNTGTVPAGGVQPTAPQALPAGMNPANPFAPPPGAALPPSTPPLPPPTEFTPDRPQTTTRGPNGETLNVTAMALPPGQSIPTGWQRQADGSITRVGAQTQPQQPGGQWTGGQTTTQPPANYQPASERFRPASERYPASQGQTQTLPPGPSRIQHGAFNPPPQQQQQPNPAVPQTPPTYPNVWPPPQQPAPQFPQTPQQPAGGVQQPASLPPVNVQPTGGQMAPLPAVPLTAQPGNRPTADPTVPSVPPIPPVAGAGTPTNFDPNSPVGAWANQPTPVILPPPPPGGTGFTPTVLPPPVADAPLQTTTIKR